MSLNKDFRDACIEAGYNKSCFTGEVHSWNDLQVCHILSKSKRTLNSIKKAYGCSKKTAELIMNMPLLNTVIGSRQDNKEYKKTDNITYIDYKIAVIALSLLLQEVDKKQFKKINILASLLQALKIISKYKVTNEKAIELHSFMIKDIQLQFHKEIDLHI